MTHSIIYITGALACLSFSSANAVEFLPKTNDALLAAEVDSLRDAEDLFALDAGNDIVIIDDMMFDAGDLLAQGFSGTKWINGKFVYEFDANVTSINQQKFQAACKVWEDVSAVNCVPRTSETNYVHVASSSYNRSFVGMVGGRQVLEVYNWNWKYIIAHEIGHALGLSHEQSRSDRDRYVEILFDNIVSGAKRNFKKSATTNHTPYDFRSIMHYGPNAFSINGGPTIQPMPGYENGAQNMGNRTYLSAQDAAGMASHYGPN